MDIVRFLKRKHKLAAYGMWNVPKMDPFLADCYKAKPYRKKGMVLIEIFTKGKTKIAPISSLLKKEFDNIQKVYRLGFPPGRNIIIVAKH
ncbi:TPA: hypothetical protein EYP38_04690 [Candidatus Micrarchaeota archaeon]|nr:hypothetical protein [Candidatus Micrarchaeota archaeon]